MVVAFGIAESPEGDSRYGSPPKGTKIRLGLRPKTPLPLSCG